MQYSETVQKLTVRLPGATCIDIDGNCCKAYLWERWRIVIIFSLLFVLGSRWSVIQGDNISWRSPILLLEHMFWYTYFSLLPAMWSLKPFLNEIWGSHGGDYDCYSVAGCDAVKSDTYVPTCQTNLLLASLGCTESIKPANWGNR